VTLKGMSVNGSGSGSSSGSGSGSVAGHQTVTRDEATVMKR
jgi:hypothetical protein